MASFRQSPTLRFYSNGRQCCSSGPVYQEEAPTGSGTRSSNQASFANAPPNGPAVYINSSINSATVIAHQPNYGSSYLEPYVALGNYHDESSSVSAGSSSSGRMSGEGLMVRSSMPLEKADSIASAVPRREYGLSSPGDSGSNDSSMPPPRSSRSRISEPHADRQVSPSYMIRPARPLSTHLSRARLVLEPPVCPEIDLTGNNSTVGFRSSYCPARIAPAEETVESCSDGCSSHSCDDECSGDDCEPDCAQSCAGTEQCQFPEMNTFPCEDPHCDDQTCYSDHYQPDAVCSLRSGASEWPNPQKSDADSGADPYPLTLCRWVMPGEQCNVSALNINELGQHVLHDHIETQQMFPCPWDECAEVLDVKQAPTHISQQHGPDRLICLWRDCGLAFSDEESLKHHMETHNDLQCHWAGCHIGLTGLPQLQTHVNQAHLHMGSQSEHQAPQSTYQLPPQQPPPIDEANTAGHNGELSDLKISASSPLERFYSPSNVSGSHSSPYETTIPSPRKGRLNAFENLNRLPSPAITDSSPLPVHMPAKSLVESIDDTAHRCMWIVNPATSQTCKMIFRNGNSLQEHVDNKHIWTQETYSPNYLPICGWLDCKRKGKPVQSREKLRRHLFTHTGYWMVSCPVCQKQFNNQASLSNHERVHTGDKPYKCKMCDQGFSTEGALTIHKRHHTGEKPLVCPSCSYTSADSSNMTKHKKTHEPPEHFCKVCGRSFSRAATLERHMIVHNPNRAPRKRRSRVRSPT